ncbi:MULTISPECIES: S-adenosylmethionine decarboxylase [Paenibacillus]|uniref:S-adenosylmethionine decarboxylase n=1 Tax=Paenibacillus TaxID=44249 RepID=UPI0022B8FBB4|nr:S-adenosylmethionine decarboxylase [Paenibacillus caseinilyticus]MCZ8519112.1 S-adenosylmethionine decarboxylase [Paenibacillus caseinilyticus]
MKRTRKKWFMYTVVALLILWPLLQIAELLGAKAPQEPAEKLLYQVSLFQMERLNSYLLESTESQNTEELNALRQALYSAQFAHGHLALAYGEEEMSPLSSLQTLMQYLLRLQVGGSRPLKPDELQTLAAAGRLYGELYASYGELVSSNGSIAGSKNDRMAEADEALTEFLKKKLP